MADVNVEKRYERGLEPRSQGGLMRRGEMGFPSFFRTNPAELFSLNPFTLMRRLTEDMDRMFSAQALAAAAAQSGTGRHPSKSVRERETWWFRPSSRALTRRT